MIFTKFAALLAAHIETWLFVTIFKFTLSFRHMLMELNVDRLFILQNCCAKIIDEIYIQENANFL